MKADSLPPRAFQRVIRGDGRGLAARAPQKRAVSSLRLLRQTKAGNQFGIYFVGFGARQAAGGKRFDGCRIDNGHAITGFVEMKGKCFAITAGRF